MIDTGVDASHEDLGGRVLPGFNEITQTTNAADDYGHGTEVAGMIAATGNNGIGVAGSCWSCKILPVKVLDSSGSGWTSDIANGIVWAVDHGANVINLSIGGSPDPAVSTALNYATAHNVFVAVAAGNNGSNSTTASYPGGYGISKAGVVSVGAIDYNRQLYSFSNYGPWVEVAAPGCELTTTMDGGYGSMCGTSAATPQVAGAAALALSFDPSLTPAQLETKIESTANPSWPTSRASVSGSSYPGDDTCAGAACTAFGMIDDAALLGSLSSTVAPVLVSAATIGGTASVGYTLSGTDATFSDGTATLSHAWLRCDGSGANCVAISGATTTSYLLVLGRSGINDPLPDDRDQQLRHDNHELRRHGRCRCRACRACPQQLDGPARRNDRGRQQLVAPPRSGQLLHRCRGQLQLQLAALRQLGRHLRHDQRCDRLCSYTLTSADQGYKLKERITATNVSGSVSRIAADRTACRFRHRP